MKRSGLRADPQSIQEWQQRSRDRAIERAKGREGQRSTELRAGLRPGEAVPMSLPKRSKRKRKAKIPGSIRGQAKARSRGRCIMCLYREHIDPLAITDAALSMLTRRGVVRRAHQCHHVLPEQKWPQLAKLLANLVGVCAGCHDNHERAHERIPRAALPQCALDLAEREGLMWFIEKTYPA